MQTTKRKYENDDYNFAFLDEGSKREIRRKLLKAIAIPGCQIPFASRDLPIAKGWGTGGLQITLSLASENDQLKVIDQGNDDSVNAVNIRRLVEDTTNISTTEDTTVATLIQSRHRIPEDNLTENQILILQVPEPEPLRRVEPREEVTSHLHAMKEYSSIWLRLYEQIVKSGNVTIGFDYPVMVHDRYLMASTPIPRWDTPKFHQAEHLTLFGAGREKKLYALPPYTKAIPIQFEDYPFEVERANGKSCRLCGSTTSYLDSSIDEKNGIIQYQCSDTFYCQKRRTTASKGKL